MPITGKDDIVRITKSPAPKLGGAKTLNEMYRAARQLLSEVPTARENAASEAALLFQKAFGIPREELFLRGEEPVPKEGAAALEELLERRALGEPLQYLLGEWEFYGIPLLVGPGVLIPRPETELLVDMALGAVRGVHAPNLMDLCSGSGCIPIALAQKLPLAKIWGVEYSMEALSYFRKNAARMGFKNLFPTWGDIFHFIPELFTRQYQVVTANPPYIPTGELGEVQREVRWEPPMALDGGKDGLLFYRRIPSLCRSLLAPGGTLLVEIGEDQGKAVADLFLEAGYRDVAVHKDLSGNDRVVSGIF